MIYAAADGLITAVDESAEDAWMPDGRCLRIVTFLDLHNVHVNRVPVAGTVAQLEAVPGGFAPALFSGAGEQPTSNRDRRRRGTGRRHPGRRVAGPQDQRLGQDR